MGGIKVGLVELGTCNPGSVREPTVRDRDQRARPRRKWKGKISWDEKWLCRVCCNPEVSESLA